MQTKNADDVVILFTAFEPSGDEHAAPVIRRLKAALPEVRIVAWGGRKMEAAGAELLELTTENAVMGVGAVGQIRSHRQRLKRIDAFVKAHRVLLHVPTDSPAANWAVCKMVKRTWGGVRDERFGMLGRVCHLVAPQVWAWASWRVRRLQKWSDHVLCLLPFEPEWFTKHDVPATFIGHPVFEEALNETQLDALVDGYEKGAVKVALLPGSRAGEIRRNWPLMKQVGEALRIKYGEVEGGVKMMVAGASEKSAGIIRESGDVPEDMKLVVGETDAVIRWADVVLVVSGTATLHVARGRRAMVVMYRVSGLVWNLLFRWLMNTKTFTLPNLIAGGGPEQTEKDHIVKEFVPYLSDEVRPIVEEVVKLIDEPALREAQVGRLDEVVEVCSSRIAGEQAGRVIIEMLGGCELGA